MPRRDGYTIIEALVVVALMGILALLASPFLSDAPGRNDLDNASLEAGDAIREAQAAVMGGRNNARFGVHFDAVKFVLFQGAVYAPADPNNIVHILPPRVSISSVSLSPGGACLVSTGAGNCAVHFADHRGTPTESGTVVFVGDDGAARTLVVGSQGMFDIN